MEKELMLKQLTVLDFMATDLHLFLNTHPGDAEAQKMYNDTIFRATELRNSYEKKYGPLVAFRSAISDGFAWADNEWPWQKDYNFSLHGHGAKDAQKHFYAAGEELL